MAADLPIGLASPSSIPFFTATACQGPSGSVKKEGRFIGSYLLSHSMFVSDISILTIRHVPLTQAYSLGKTSIDSLTTQLGALLGLLGVKATYRPTTFWAFRELLGGEIGLFLLCLRLFNVLTDKLSIISVHQACQPVAEKYAL